MNPNQFDLPLPPPGLVFPQVPQFYATVVMHAIVAVVVIATLVQAYRSRSLMGPLLLIGGALSYFNEPIVDVLGLCWHPRPGQWVAINTFGPVPWWGLGIYILFFGAMPQLLLGLARRGITRRQFWIGVLAFFALDFACELPLIHLGLYHYYGEPPFEILGLPAYWLFINTPGPLIDVALLLRGGSFFTGWRRFLIPLLPMTTDAAGSLASGWPIFSALNTPGASMELKCGAALLTIAIGLVLFEALSRLICSAAVAGQRSASASRAAGLASHPAL